METRTYYIPANKIGRYLLNHLVDKVGCSVGNIRRVGTALAVVITTTKRDMQKVERILQMYDLM